MEWRIVFLALNVLVLVGIVWIYRRVRQTQPSGGAEASESRRSSQSAKELETKESWRRLDLEKMHRINREEVERLLAKLAESSIRALTPSERAFLDRMVEAERRADGTA